MNIALVLSGGTGSRMGLDTPKQYISINGRPIISYCIETLVRQGEIDAIQIVAEPQWQELILETLVMAGGREKFRGFSNPGENRQLSIFQGMKDIWDYASGDDLILIHDAARPLLGAEQITACLQAVEGHDGVMPVLPMKDTVYYSRDRKKVSLLDRTCVFAGQAPEVFRLGPYYEANYRLLPEKIFQINGSTEPALLAGLDVLMIPGDEGNFKITTREDLKRFCQQKGDRT
ncbi:MAG: 2-C-methyl-D-erythritol 4-phosphate cytidylyltransferase [Lachnospiraceae bacterium]|nr:2-C-methyl-D-erythritol 4-phosphate cytidylyltransferase [Lachnospiraceae bacterium]